MNFLLAVLLIANLLISGWLWVVLIRPTSEEIRFLYLYPLLK